MLGQTFSVLASMGIGVLFAQLPASSNFKLNSFDVGGGGTANSTSSNYALEGIAGQQSAGQISSTNYKTNSGFIYSRQANVPVAPTFTNPSNYYNKLHFVVNTSSNPSDARFAIAISDDNFVTTEHIQNDNTIGSALGLEDYQTYANWGSGSGEDVVGLTPNTTYKIKVKATQGKFTESGFGPEASVATVGPQLSFSISPASINLGTLLTTTVTTSSNITISFATNAENGGDVFVFGANSGLDSVSASDTINSATADLGSAPSGYGAVSSSASQASGGPFSAQSPFDGAGDNVGILDLSIRGIYATAGPVTGGSGVFVIKAKPSSINKIASDYSDALNLISVGQF